MSRTKIYGEQVADESLTGTQVQDETLTGDDVQDETLTGDDVQDGSLLRKDLSLSVFDFASKVKVVSNGQDFTGGSFQQYDIVTFNVSEATNKFRLNTDFIWSHSSGANDARFQLWLDGNLYGEELRIEPKDAGNDQRIQNNITDYVENLSVGSHTIELRARPSTASKVTQIYKNVLEVWRVA